MEYKYRAVFKNSGVRMETGSFRHLYRMVKLTLTSDYIEDMRKPEIVFFEDIEDNRGLFIALERRIKRSEDGEDTFEIILHYFNDEYILRSFSERSC